LPVRFDVQWNQAIGRYQAAIALCDRVVDEITHAVSEGVVPTAISFSKEERARAELVDARTALLFLLREKSELPND
jgi:hypothetical protein